MNLVLPIAIIIAAVLLLALVLGLVALARRPRRLPYRMRDALLTPAELSFYQVLRNAVSDDLDVFAKVRLIDLLWLPAATNDRQLHLNKVMAKHVDFVLCDRRTSAPRLAIELDDSSHANRAERDAFVDRVMEAAGLPILRIRAKRAYNQRELAEAVGAALQALDH